MKRYAPPAELVAWFRVNFSRAACNVKHDEPPLGGDKEGRLPGPVPLVFAAAGNQDYASLVSGFRSAAECGYRRHGYSMTRYPAPSPVRAGALRLSAPDCQWLCGERRRAKSYSACRT
jgi:hypothetical protein